MNTIKNWKPVYSGKVRELYIPREASVLAEADRLLIVATDRVSAFDHILEPTIPGKGKILTHLSHWWFDQLSDVPNHLTGETPPTEVLDTAMVVTPLVMFPVECVVRGYLAGSGWKEYQETGAISGVGLPQGLSEGDPLPEPIFTPATKAPVGDHDVNISLQGAIDLVGSETAHALQELSLSIYQRAHAIAAQRGIILADTKFEFGRHPTTGAITLGDEVLTSDSSRYWDGGKYSSGGIDRLDSFDKQLIRNWLANNWDGQGAPPTLPPELVAHTMQRYQELVTRITGQPFPSVP
jgi:phosphoribosylaminoimidazole-succinocarboxamide synthase